MESWMLLTQRARSAIALSDELEYSEEIEEVQNQLCCFRDIKER